MPKTLPYLWRGKHPETPSYALSSAAIVDATRNGFEDILWINPDHEFTESSIANIFFIARDGDEVEILTPAEHSGLLTGITRENLLALLPKEGIETRKEVIYADQLPRFDEAFVTSTVRGLVPVSLIGKHQLHSANPKSIFQSIHELYLRDVARKLGRRVNW